MEKFNPINSGFNPIQKENVLEKTLSESIKKLVEMIDGITEFNQNELKALSMIQSIKPLKDLTEYYVKNKKHLKRKHSSEILKALKNISNAISGISNENQDKSFLNIFNRDK